MESILMSIKTSLGVDPDYDGFDTEIIIAINGAIFSLSQLGIGPDGGFTVTGIAETWVELFDGVSNLEAAKNYILLSSRLIFDPPTTSFLIGAVERQKMEMCWRLMTEVDPELVEEV